jgi:hypothetical protein
VVVVQEQVELELVIVEEVGVLVATNMMQLIQFWLKPILSLLELVELQLEKM